MAAVTWSVGSLTFGVMGSEVRTVVGLETTGDSSELWGFMEARVSMGSAGNGDECGDGCEAISDSLELWVRSFWRPLTRGPDGVLLRVAKVKLPLGKVFEPEPPLEEV
jgi:hypothetical protein